MSTCFHPVHLNCYANLDKDNKFCCNCPLCQFKTNCIIPAVPGDDDKVLLKICRNTTYFALMATYKIYYCESLFSLVFKHLVESKGLNSLMSHSLYQNKRKAWARNDAHMEAYMMRIYDCAY